MQPRVSCTARQGARAARSSDPPSRAGMGGDPSERKPSERRPFERDPSAHSPSAPFPLHSALPGSWRVAPRLAWLVFASSLLLLGGACGRVLGDVDVDIEALQGSSGT